MNFDPETISVIQYFANCTWPFFVMAFLFHLTTWYLTGWLPYLEKAFHISSRGE